MPGRFHIRSFLLPCPIEPALLGFDWGNAGGLSSHRSVSAWRQKLHYALLFFLSNSERKAPSWVIKKKTRCIPSPRRMPGRFHIRSFLLPCPIEPALLGFDWGNAGGLSLHRSVSAWRQKLHYALLFFLSNSERKAPSWVIKRKTRCIPSPRRMPGRFHIRSFLLPCPIEPALLGFDWGNTGGLSSHRSVSAWRQKLHYALLFFLSSHADTDAPEGLLRIPVGKVLPLLLSIFDKNHGLFFAKLSRSTKGKKPLAICEYFVYNPHEKKIFKLRYRETGKIHHREQVRMCAHLCVCVSCRNLARHFFCRLEESL